MGIVVCVFMLLGAILLFRPQQENGSIYHTGMACMVACMVLALGFWNAAWYGLRHLDKFWGIAAIISGLLMMATGVILLSMNERFSFLHSMGRALSRFRTAILLGLLLCFLLYAITLIRLNLGLPIIR